MPSWFRSTYRANAEHPYEHAVDLACVTEDAFYYRRKGEMFFRIVLAGYDPHAEALAFKDPARADAIAALINP